MRVKNGYRFRLAFGGRAEKQWDGQKNRNLLEVRCDVRDKESALTRMHGMTPGPPPLVAFMKVYVTDAKKGPDSVAK